ncbi:hypothetical protein C3L33_05921, partial [Rhododendron williamsianum]
KKEYSRYLPLYKAALRGDWATAEKFFDKDPGALTAPITEFSRTALYVAAVNGRNTNGFVNKLVDKMPPGSVDEAYGNVLNLAAYVGNTESVKVLLSKNRSLINDEDSSKLFPDEDSAAFLMDETIRSGYYDVPVKSVDCIISPTLTVLVENSVDDPDQAMGWKYNWARLLVEYFCISGLSSI